MRNELRVLLLFPTELVLLLVFRAHLRRLRRLGGLAGRDDLWTGCHTGLRCPRLDFEHLLYLSSSSRLFKRSCVCAAKESDANPSALLATNRETKKAHLYADIQVGMCKVQLVHDWWWEDAGSKRLANRLPARLPPSARLDLFGCSTSKSLHCGV